jgi:hypothetical protein
VSFLLFGILFGVILDEWHSFWCHFCLLALFLVAFLPIGILAYWHLFDVILAEWHSFVLFNSLSND